MLSSTTGFHTEGNTSNYKKTVVVKPDEDNMEEEPIDDANIAKEAGNVMKSLNKLSSPDQKLEVLVKKYAELAEARRADDKRQRALQQKHGVLIREKENLQAENSRSILARSKMEALCRELQRQNKSLKEETLARCREDEEKRTEISEHFQSTLVDIQAQIEQHSNRNQKLCNENAQLADKLDSLMTQYENREEQLEKLNKHRDLQLKLADTRLEQSNALLAEAEEKHKREKEYLLREAIDKTKKCYAMKEQELTLKKKLTLYSQKFDEFQITLAKSNDIYVSFKQEMDKMTGKMKKLEKESSIWKTRFESCNQALAGMIEERAEKDKEFESFVVKIQKLELLCRALQEERKALYDKIKDVRSANSEAGLVFHTSMNLSEELLATPVVVSADAAAAAAPGPGLLTTLEIQEIADQDPVLTQSMNSLKDQQARLQEFAASLLSPSSDGEEDKDDSDGCEDEEDEVTSAFASITKQTQKKKTAAEEEKVEAKPDAEAPKAEAAVVAEPTSKTEEIHKETTPEQEEQLIKSVAVTATVKKEASLAIESTDSRPEPEKVEQPTPTAPVPVENKQVASEPLSAPAKKVESIPPAESKPAVEKVQAELMEVEQPAAAPVQEQTTQKERCAEPVPEEAALPVQSETGHVSRTSHADRANNNNSNPQQPMRKKKKRNNKKV